MRKISQKVVALAILMLSILAFGINEAVADPRGGIGPGSSGGTGVTTWCAK